MKHSIHLPIFVAAVLLAGCQAPRSAQAPGLRVLAAETFLGDIAQNVGGERVHVETLLRPGVDPHEFQPTPQDAIRIEQSQVLIVNGLGYETWLTKSLQDGRGQTPLVVASEGLSPMADPSAEHPEGDPHMWMNPLNVIRYVENIRDGLSKADPAGTAAYTSNADIYISKLRELDQSIKDQVARIPPAKRLLVTNHDALGYLADAYSFQIIGAVIPSVTTEASTSAQGMADLIQTIRASEAPAIFLDVSENQKLADQIAAESGAKVVTGLYVETLSGPNGPAATYIEMMKYDVTLIAGALE
jgi:zinc/manganese transport system substrate-binding protein